MSVEQVKVVVEKFVSDEHNDLLIIKGGWGVGKTYFWHHLIQDASEKKAMSKKYYSYVSLFGVNDLEELKNAILVAGVDSASVKSDDYNKGLLVRSKQLLKGVEKIPILREWTGGIAGEALFLLVRDMLICFDDIERKGDDLDIKTILGLASLLKEQRNCKIAFIMNDSSFPDDEVDEFRRHNEKVVDLELQFSPSSEEAFDYVFSTIDPYYDFLKSCCLSLGIKNIRTIQRIKRFIISLSPYLNGNEMEVIEDALRSLVLYVKSYFDKDNTVPSLEYILKYQSYDAFLSTSNESEDRKRWNSFLYSYGYRNTDEVDKHLASLVETGYLDYSSFNIELGKKNEQVYAQQGQAAYRKVWNLWTYSFDNNEEELIGEIVAKFRSNMRYLSIYDLQSAVEVLRDLGHEQLANDLIDDYFVHLGNSLVEINFKYIPFMDKLKDHYLLERLNKARQLANRDERSVAEVVEKLVSREGWDTEDITILSVASIDDYYNLFKSVHSERLYFYIKACLRFGENNNSDNEYARIAKKAEEALLRIASENNLNRLRVSRIYDIATQ